MQKLLLTNILLLSAIINCVFCGAVGVNKNDPDAIMFPGDSGESVHFHSRGNFQQHNKKSSKNETVLPNIQQIPLSLIQQINDIDNITILLENYLDGEEKLKEDIGLANRFGTLEKAQATMPKPALCIPTPQTVELKLSNDPSLFIFPSCTRVDRCGGCCSHSLLSCQPVQMETISFQVIVSQYTGGTKLNVKGKEIVQVEKHTKCKCDCKIKKEDCNSFQEYRKDECRCVCANLDEKKKCEKFNETKLWDPNLCKCRCREISDCTTGLYFDQSRCACMSIPVRRRFADLYSSREKNFSDKDKYEIDAPAVAPLTIEDEEESAT